MDSESDLPLRRVPTLVSLCQRAAIGQGVESIFTLGSDLTYSLVKPILEKCNAEQLSRFEHLSPHLQKDTPELWKARCFSDYPLPAERYIDDDPEEPETWRSRFLELRESESKRMDELASKLRTQRMEADERKKEKEVKYTDRVPSAKRPRYGSTQPKTLFQKTKSDASKVQRAYYNTRVIPPMPASKKHRVLPQNPGATLSPVPSSSSGSRVVVNTVIRRPLVSTSSSAASGSLVGRARVSTLKAPSSHPFPSDAPNSPSISERPDAHSSNSSLPHTVVDPPRPMAKLPTPKKDPMASLFVPKRKPPPQRSV